jgi:hypothetical protein
VPACVDSSDRTTPSRAPTRADPRAQRGSDGIHSLPDCVGGVWIAFLPWCSRGTAEVLNDLFAFDPLTLTWVDLSAGAAGAPPLARAAHSLAALGERLYIHAGFLLTGASRDTIAFAKPRSARGLGRKGKAGAGTCLHW